MSVVDQIRLEKRSKVPIQHQLKRHIQFLIFTGELRQGDRLPPVRALANRVGVNRNTVSQVYRDLEREHWLQGRPGSGTFVDATEHVRAGGADPLREIVNGAVEQAVALGFREEDLLRTLQGRLRMRRSRAPNLHDDDTPPWLLAGRSYL